MSRLKTEFNKIIQNSGFDIKQLNYDILDTNEKIEALFNTIKYIYKFIKQELIPNVNVFIKDNKKSKAINHLFLRIYCQIKSLIKLNEITDFQCISFIARSIIELYTDMVLISNELIENGIQKYYSFQKIQLYKISKNQSFSGCNDSVLKIKSNPLNKYYENNKNVIDDIIVKNWGKDRNEKPLWPSHWSGLDLYSRINKTSSLESHFSELKKHYFNIHPYCNLYIHSDPSGTQNKTEELYFVLVCNLYFNLIEIIVDGLNLYKNYFNINKTIPSFK